MSTLFSGALLLKRLRQKEGLTQHELAQQAGYTSHYISMLERGKRTLHRKAVERLCDVLHASADDRQALMQAVAAPDLPPVFIPGKPTVPVPMTALIGRSAEVADALNVLRGKTRLFTITGPVGVGKSHLALHLAALLRDQMTEDVYWLDGLAVPSADQLLPLLMAQLHVNPSLAASDIDALVATIYPLRVLVVIDQFDHLMAARNILAHLLAFCPRLKLCVTSRTALRLRGERIVSLHPLPLPGDDQLITPEAALQFPAIALFVERAQAAALPSGAAQAFTLTEANVLDVVAICRALDALPLAIDLIAPYVALYAPAQLLHLLADDEGTEHLSLQAEGPTDAPQHQHTLRQAIAWSYDRLPEREQALLRGLALLVDGWSQDLAEAIGAAQHLSPSAVAVALAHLADYNLIFFQTNQTDEAPRGKMLHTIRVFCLAQFVQPDELLRLQECIADAYLRVCQQILSMTVHRQRWLALQQSAVEYANIRAILAWAEVHQPERYLPVLLQWWTAMHQPSWSPAPNAFPLLIHVDETLPLAVRVLLLAEAAHYVASGNDHAGALSLYHAACDLQERAHLGQVLAPEKRWAQVVRLATDGGEFALAEDCSSQLQRHAQRQGDPPLYALALYNRGALEQTRGCQAAAMEWYERSAWHGLHFDAVEGHFSENRAVSALKAGEIAQAEAHFTQALAIETHPPMRIHYHHLLAHTMLARGEWGRAHTLFRQAVALRAAAVQGFLPEDGPLTPAVATQRGHELLDALTLLYEAIAIDTAQGDAQAWLDGAAQQHPILRPAYERYRVVMQRMRWRATGWIRQTPYRTITMPDEALTRAEGHFRRCRHLYLLVGQLIDFMEMLDGVVVLSTFAESHVPPVPYSFCPDYVERLQTLLARWGHRDLLFAPMSVASPALPIRPTRLPLADYVYMLIP